jgi:Sec-independent protein secretion pathway component TatC
MYLLYEGGILFARLMVRSNEKRRAQQEEGSDA